VYIDESPDWNIENDGSVVCDLCGTEPATMHLLRVVDGVVSHTHLCPGCAESVAEENEGLALVLAVPSVLRHLGRSAPADETPPDPPEREERFCGVCGTTLTDLRESGMVGCINCYQVFIDYLQTSFETEGEPVEHLGKMPLRGPESDALKHEMMRLQRMLRELVECERFEEAAGVRDRLTELGQRLDGDPS